jgi:hypothetical protein
MHPFFNPILIFKKFIFYHIEFREGKVGGALAFALLGSALGWETHTKSFLMN